MADERVLEIEVELETEETIIELDMSEVIISGGELPPYQGDYVIIPKVKQSQTLETKNKSMKDNVLVQEIPYTEVHNNTGITFTIGGE